MNEKKATAPEAAASGTDYSTPSAASVGSAPSYSAASAEVSADTQPQTEATLVDQVVEQGKKWINDSNFGQRLNDLPQTVSDLGNRAVDRVKNLSTTQKIVGGAILAAGLGWLATRGRSAKSSPDEDAYAAASSNRPGTRYASKRGSASYSSSDNKRGTVGSYGGQQPDSRTSYKKGNHFSAGDADGFSNDADY